MLWTEGNENEVTWLQLPGSMQLGQIYQNQVQTLYTDTTTTTGYSSNTWPNDSAYYIDLRDTPMTNAITHSDWSGASAINVGGTNTKTNWRSVINSGYVLTKTEEDEDKTVYIFNECDEAIFAYKEDEKEVECYEDNVNKDKKSSGAGSRFTEINSNIGSFKKNLLVTSLSWNTALMSVQDPGTLVFHSVWIVPKLRMKLYEKYNNLNKLKNGKCPIGDDFATFYGGLPLFNADVTGTASFKIKISNTVDGDHTKHRLYIAKKQFPNTTNLNDFKDYLVVAKADKVANTEKYLDIVKDEEHKIEFDIGSL